MTTITDPKHVNPGQLLDEIIMALPVLVADDTALVTVASESNGVTVWLDDSQSALVDEVEALIDAHVPQPLPIRKLQVLQVAVEAVTTDDQPVTIYRLPCEVKHIYESTLKLFAADRGNFAAKLMEGRFGHQRLLGGALAIGAGIVVLSDLHQPAAASWAPNALPSGSDVVFTVKGAAGRTIDWEISGQIVVYAPEGLTE